MAEPLVAKAERYDAQGKTEPGTPPEFMSGQFVVETPNGPRSFTTASPAAEPILLPGDQFHRCTCNSVGTKTLQTAVYVGNDPLNGIIVSSVLSLH